MSTSMRLRKLFLFAGVLALMLTLLTGAALADKGQPPTTATEQETPAEKGQEADAPDALTSLLAYPAGAYTFSFFDGAYTEVISGTAGPAGDDSRAAVTLPFTFTYAGVDYNNGYLSTNGWLKLGEPDPGTSVAGNNLESTTYLPFLAPLWDDMDVNVATGGVITYTTEGTTPNRVFVVQWKNVEWYYSDLTQSNFQLRLYETSNVIEFVYGTMVTPTNSSANASIGLNSAPGGAGNFLSVTPGNPPTASSAVENDQIDTVTYLSSGKTYRFTPPPPAPTFGTSSKKAPARAAIGEVITYTIHITNTGELAAANATLSDPLPAGSTYVAASLSCSPGACGYDAGGNAITWTAALAVNAGAVVIFAVDTDGAACGNLVNTATIADPAYPAIVVNKQASTVLMSVAPVLDESFDGATFPPTDWGTTDVTGTTATDWTRVAGNGGSPTIAPHSGAAMARYNAYSISTYGNSTRLYTKILDLSGMTAPALKFWMSHDNALSDRGDRIQAQISTDGGTTYSDVGKPVTRWDAACTTACWKEHMVDLSAYAGQSNVRIGLLAVSEYGNNIFVDDVSLAEAWYPCPSLFVDSASGAACPNATKDYRLTVVNAHSVTDTINVTFAGNAWPTSIAPAALSLGPGARGVVTVSVSVPWEATGLDSTLVTAAGQSSGLTAQAQVDTAANAPGYTDYEDVPVAFRTRDHSVVYYNGKLYKIGGYRGASTGVLNSTIIYDIATNRWSLGAAMPGSRYWVDCVEIGGLIYCAGGFDTATRNTLYIYNPATDTWSIDATDPLPAARYNYAGVALGGYYYVIGGMTGPSNTLYRYDPTAAAGSRWTTLNPMGTARRHHSAGVIGGKIYVAGGYSGSVAINTAEVYDPATNTWTYVANLPATLPDGTAISGWMRAADAVEEDRYLILAGGGYMDGQASLYVLAYDAQVNTWQWLPSMRHLIYSAEADSDGTNVWIVSGRTYESGNWSYGRYTTKLARCSDCRFDFSYNDLEDAVYAGETVYVPGDFNAWSTSALAMTPNADSSVFTATTTLTHPGGLFPWGYGYKYYVESAALVGNSKYDMLNTANRTAYLTAARTIIGDYRNVTVGWAKLDPPFSQLIALGSSAQANGQVYVQNVTNPAGEGRGLMAQIAYGYTSTLPATWFWGDLAYLSDSGNNDVSGGVFTPTASGVFSYATRFDGNWGAGNPNAAWAYGDADGALPFSLNQTGLLTVQPGNLAVAPTILAATLATGTAEQTLTISNTGAGDLPWSIAENPAVAWLSETPSSGLLGPLSSTGVTVTFDAAGVPAGVHTSTLDVSNDDLGNPQLIPVAVTLTVQTAYGLALEPPADAQAGLPGASVEHTLRLTNTGNTTDTFDITYAGNVWNVSVPTTVYTLPAFAGADVVAYVDIPSTAMHGDGDAVDITVTSRGDGSTDSSTLTTSVNAPTTLAITKIGPAVAMAGSTITYTIHYTNTGVYTAVNTVVRDTLPVDAYFLRKISGKEPATDSASSATTMSTGYKTDDGNIAWLPGDPPGGSLTTIAETLRATRGFAIGAVSTVPASHATPASFISHNVYRNNYYAIMHEAIFTTTPDVVIGGGHPLFNTAGYQYISSADYAALNATGVTPYTHFVSRTVGIDGGTALIAAASTVNLTAGDKLFGLFGGSGANFEYHQASDTPGSPSIARGSIENPLLADMVTATLGVLSQDSDGFFVLFEQGDIDWSNHANRFEDMVGGIWDLDQAVRTTEAFIGQPGGPEWSDTLVIVTADHSNGYMRTPVPLGAGDLPAQMWVDYDKDSAVDDGEWAYPDGEVTYRATQHVNELVTLQARGAGAGLFANYVGLWYPGTQIVDDTYIYQVMLDATNAGVKHVILFVGDGTNINHERAGSRYLYGVDDGLAWDQWGSLADGWAGYASTWDVTAYNKYASVRGAANYVTPGAPATLGSNDPLIGYNLPLAGSLPFPLEVSDGVVYVSGTACPACLPGASATLTYPVGLLNPGESGAIEVVVHISDTIIGPIFNLADIWANNAAVAGAVWRTNTCSSAITVLNDQNSGAGSLRQAIADVCPGGVIDFGLSSYPATIMLSSELLVNKSLTINGPGADNLTVSGNDAVRVFSTSGAAVAINNLTVAHGYVNGDGGGIYNSGGLSLANVTLSHNTAVWWGGGLYNHQGAVSLDTCQVYSNSVGEAGGGLANEAYDITSTASLVMSYTTVSGNTSGGGGGGVYNRNGTLRLEACTLRGNVAGGGGGLGSQAVEGNTSVEINDSQISNNRSTAEGGGGLVNSSKNYKTAEMTLNRSLVQANISSGTSYTQGFGGGVWNTYVSGPPYNSLSIMTLNDSTVSGNQAVNGGGIGNGSMNPVNVALFLFLNNSTVSGNTAVPLASPAGTGNGGGVMNINGALHMLNSTVSGNAAQGVNPAANSGLGGGLVNATAGLPTSLVLTNTTIANNMAPIGGGLAAASLGGPSSAQISSNASLIAGNVAVYAGVGCYLGSGATFSSGDYNLEDGNTCNLTAAHDLINTDPQLGPLADNGGETPTHALLPNSPAIDAGSPTGPATDQRGQTRDDLRGDIGAFELKFEDSPVVVKAVAGPGVYTFGPTMVAITITTYDASLNSLTITRTNSPHPQGTVGITPTNRYWSISPNAGAAGYMATLALLHDNLSAPSACKYPGNLGGSGWDCASVGHDSRFVWRDGLTSFSDWAVGDAVGPTAIMLQAMAARQDAPVALLLVGAIVLGAVCVVLRRRK